MTKGAKRKPAPTKSSTPKSSPSKGSKGQKARGAKGAPNASPFEGGAAAIYVAIIAFCTGASVMIVELAASRVLAPHFGNTLYTWTALIGVIMIALSVGYYGGGRLADRAPHPSYLLHLVAAAAALVLLVPLMAESVVGSLTEEEQAPDLLWGPVWAALLLFALPGCLLGSVTPFAIKLLSLHSANEKVGTSAGTVSMVSTFGSVVGTFGSGFVLIPNLGIRTIFISVGVVLAALAAIGYGGMLARSRSVGVAALVFIGASLVGVFAHGVAEARHRHTIFQQDTFYHQIQVRRWSVGEGNTITELLLDNTPEGAQTNEGGLVYGYTRYYQLEKIFCPQMRRAAFIGGGAYSMPQALVDDHPDLVVDVAEIDPTLEQIGREYFRLDEYEGKVRPVATDGRAFLIGAQDRYDLIFGDAYRGRQNVPHHLVTKEFFELLRSRLTEDGVYMMNVIGGLEGSRSMFFRSIAATVKSVFPELYVFATYPGLVDSPQNLILVAPNNPRTFDADELVRRAGDDFRLAHMARNFVDPESYDLSDVTVFTDDFNPAEYIVARQLRDDEEE